MDFAVLKHGEAASDYRLAFALATIATANSESPIEMI